MPEKIITKEALSYFKGKYDDQMDDVLAGKQATLVSGENIKTINNESILGPGNINISGGSGSAAPYVLQDYELDLEEEEFECSTADAEYIFENNPTAIMLDGVVAVARGITDDESKNEHIRSYAFFEFPDDDQMIVYELVLYWDGSEYSFDIKPTDPIGGGGEEKVYPIAVTANPGVGDTLLAAAQNLTMEEMPDVPPGYSYTYAPFTLENDINYTEPYDAVLVEFGAGHQYLIPRLSADSGTAVYGEADGTGMPVFNNYPAAVVFILNSGSLVSVMLVSDVASGTLVDTSLHGYKYSETNFSLSANGIYGSNIDAAVAAGKVPVAVIDWRYKNYKSWCPATVHYGENYEFKGEYKGKELTVTNNTSTWSLAWDTPNIYPANITLAQDYSKMYFTDADITYLKNHVPSAIKAIWDDGEGHSGSFVMNLSTTQEGGQADMPRIYSMMMIEGGTLSVMSLKIDGGYTAATGCPIEMYSPQ